MTFTCTRVFLHCGIATFTRVKDANASSPAAASVVQLNGLKNVSHPVVFMRLLETSEFGRLAFLFQVDHNGVRVVSGERSSFSSQQQSHWPALHAQLTQVTINQWMVSLSVVGKKGSNLQKGEF